MKADIFSLMSYTSIGQFPDKTPNYSHCDDVATCLSDHIQSTISSPVITRTDPPPPPPAEAAETYERDLFTFILNEVIVPLLFGIITFVGVVGNSLVIYVILSKDRMRTVTNLLLLNLAVADFLFALVIPSVTAYQFATSRWPFGDIACKLMHYAVNVTAYITVYTLVLISILRYMTIVHNANTVRFRTRRNVALIIFTMWMMMLALNVPILMSYKVKVDSYGRLDCEHNTKEVGRCVFATFFAFAYVLPLAIIAVISICILHHITKHRSVVLSTKSRQVYSSWAEVFVYLACLVHAHVALDKLAMVKNSLVKANYDTGWITNRLLVVLFSMIDSSSSGCKY